MKKNKNITITLGSGNVFTDLGISDPQERLAKSELAYQITRIIEEKELSQTEAAKLLDVDQPKISALYTGKLSGFSLERLIRFLNILDQDITIQVKPKIKAKNKAVLTVRLSTAKATKKVKVVKKPAESSNNILPVQARKKK